VLLVVGVFVLFYWHEAYSIGSDSFRASAGTLGLIATVLLGTGVALMIASGLSYRLARKTGLLDARESAVERASEIRSDRTSA
jgi:hypothetical protein